MSAEVQITIIGGGVIGCAIACELSKKHNQGIVVVEKNRQIRGENQSSRNSGIIHAGVFYPKEAGPLKAKLCGEGNEMLYRFCDQYNLPHKKTGKIIVATATLEEEYLEDVYRIALENQVPGIEKIDGNRVYGYEPNVSAISALYVPTSGIIEPTGLVDKLYRISESNGVMFLIGNEAVGIKPESEGFEVKVRSDTEIEIFKTRILINAAGLYSDDIARMVNPGSPYRMDPVKGEWAKFYKTKREDIFMNGLSVYPVPFGYLPSGEKLKIPFKEFREKFIRGEVNKSVGVHLGPAFEMMGKEYIIGDTVIMGPAYSRPNNKEDYSQTREENYYLDMVKPFFPGLKLEDISLHQAGIRAKLKDYYDFVIERDQEYPDLVNLVGIDSPGLTSSLAIAGYVSKLLRS